MTPKQREMLLSFHRDGEATDLCDFDGPLGWRNRERVIDALVRKGLLDKDLHVTAAGLVALGVEVETDHLSEAEFEAAVTARGP